MLRPYQADFRQPLQDLRQRLLRNAVGFGDILGAACALVGVLSQCFMAMSP